MIFFFRFSDHSLWEHITKLCLNCGVNGSHDTASCTKGIVLPGSFRWRPSVGDGVMYFMLSRAGKKKEEEEWLKTPEGKEEKRKEDFIFALFVIFPAVLMILILCFLIWTSF